MLAVPALLSMLTTICLIGPTEGPPPLTLDKHVDYIGWYNQYVSQNKKDNAWELYKFSDSDSKQGDGFPAPEGEVKDQCSAAMKEAWKPGDHPALAAYLKQRAPHFEMLQKATQRHDYWQPIPADTKSLFDVILPNLSSGRSASQALLAQAMMKQDNQAKVLIDACRTVLRVADHMHQSGFFIGELVSMAERAAVYQAASAAVRDGVIGGKDLATLYTTIRQFDPAAILQPSSLFVEQAMSLDTLQCVCPNGKLDAERWKGILLIGSDNTQIKDEQKDFDPQEALRLANEFYKETLAGFSKPLSLKNAREFGQVEQNQVSKFKQNAFTAAMMPSLTRAYHLQLRTEALRRGTLLTLAIHAHHAKHGKWPESLAKIDDQAVFEDLKALRQDPFSDGEFVYKLVDDQPLFYSVSSNGKDDNGRHDQKWGDGESESDYVIWPVPLVTAGAKPAPEGKPAATKP